MSDQRVKPACRDELMKTGQTFEGKRRKASLIRHGAWSPSDVTSPLPRRCLRLAIERYGFRRLTGAGQTRRQTVRSSFRPARKRQDYAHRIHGRMYRVARPASRYTALLRVSITTPLFWRNWESDVLSHSVAGPKRAVINMTAIMEMTLIRR
jgi:hypothetical protein